MNDGNTFATMKRPLRPWTTIATAITSLVFVRTVLSQGIVGICFSTIAEINTEMQTELERISGGGTPEDSYTYILCSDTFFDATNTTLVPLLDNANFMCGDDGNRLNGCVILGGTEQVRFQDSNITGYPINQVNFVGITFAGFEQSTADKVGASIVASASSTTVAKFTDTAWQVRVRKLKTLMF
jgi:hypothetical protein